MEDNQHPTPKVSIRRVTNLNWIIISLTIMAVVAIAFAVNAYLHSLNAVKQQTEFDLTRTSVSEQDKVAIEALIEKALAFEFAEYKSAEKADTLGLSDYFVAGSPAYMKVCQNINGVYKRGWTLNNEGNASYFALLEVDVVNSDGETAEATTRENWYLDYAQLSTGKSVYTYSQLNCQYYQLKKTETGWKIYLNHYPSTNIIFAD